MRVETILGVTLVVVSVGNCILYTWLRNKITLLEEIINGFITKDEIIKFDDYKWECTNPSLGG